MDINMDTMVPLGHWLPAASNFYVSVITQRFMVAHDLRNMTMQFFKVKLTNTLFY
jgi:hypothetical protein